MVGSADVGWNEGKVTEGTFEGVRLGIENVGSMLGEVEGHVVSGEFEGASLEGECEGNDAVGDIVGK